MNEFKLNTKSLTLLNIVTILSIKNWPFMAEYGVASIAFILIPALLFFLPVALVSAELATGWPYEGGIFIWVKEAMGDKVGFLAAWLLWISNVVWYPTILSFVAIAFSYIFDPTLAENKVYNFILIISIFWGTMLLNLKALEFSSKISSLGALFGTLLPGALIIIFGWLWFFSGHPTEITFSWNALLPPLSSTSEWVFITGILLGFAGIEMNAIHANNVENPQKNYPKAIFLSAFVIVFLSILGTLSISFVLPPEKMNLAGATIEAISFFLNAYNLPLILPFFCFFVVLGGIGSMSVWIIGPNKGLVSAAQNGKHMPKLLCHVNKRGVPIGIMLFQAIIVTVLTSVFLFFPNVNAAFWALIALASQLYLVMYILMFISAIILKYKRPTVSRAFVVPFGKTGLWVVCTLGCLCSMFAIGVGFIPPKQLEVGSYLVFELFLVLSMAIFCILPLIKKSSQN